jgi:hypothetical protein
VVVVAAAAAAAAGTLFAFLPAILRGILGRPPFGSNARQAAFFGVSFFCTAAVNHFMILFAWAPCLWYYSELRIARGLLSLIAPDRGLGFAWSTHRDTLAQARRRPLPRLDLRRGANVVAWGALWRVLHGRSFCPGVELKLQVGDGLMKI